MSVGFGLPRALISFSEIIFAVNGYQVEEGEAKVWNVVFKECPSKEENESLIQMEVGNKTLPFWVYKGISQSIEDKQLVPPSFSLVGGRDRQRRSRAVIQTPDAVTHPGNCYRNARRSADNHVNA